MTKCEIDPSGLIGPEGCFKQLEPPKFGLSVVKALYFLNNSSELTKDQRQGLAKWGQEQLEVLLNKYDPKDFRIVVQITASASEPGSDKYNLELSEQRGEAMQDVLDKALPSGVATIKVIPLGESEASGNMEDDRNAQVRIFAFSKTGGKSS